MLKRSVDCIIAIILWFLGLLLRSKFHARFIQVLLQHAAKFCAGYTSRPPPHPDPCNYVPEGVNFLFREGGTHNLLPEGDCIVNQVPEGGNDFFQVSEGVHYTLCLRGRQCLDLCMARESYFVQFLSKMSIISRGSVRGVKFEVCLAITSAPKYLFCFTEFSTEFFVFRILSTVSFQISFLHS